MTVGGENSTEGNKYRTCQTVVNATRKKRNDGLEKRVCVSQVAVEGLLDKGTVEQTPEGSEEARKAVSEINLPGRVKSRDKSFETGECWGTGVRTGESRRPDERSGNADCAGLCRP